MRCRLLGLVAILFHETVAELFFNSFAQDFCSLFGVILNAILGTAKDAEHTPNKTFVKNLAPVDVYVITQVESIVSYWVKNAGDRLFEELGAKRCRDICGESGNRTMLRSLVDHVIYKAVDPALTACASNAADFRNLFCHDLDGCCFSACCELLVDVTAVFGNLMGCRAEGSNAHLNHAHSRNDKVGRLVCCEIHSTFDDIKAE